MLAPLFTALLSVSSRGRCIFLTWLCGVTFFTGSLHFLTFVAFAAWPALAILESLYWILLGVLFFEARKFSSRIFRILWLALSFTAVEFLRAEIPVWAFGLNLLGHSQAFQPALIQVASLGGAVLLTFLIVFANACFAEYWIGKKNQRFLLAAALVVLLFVFLFGIVQLKKSEVKNFDSLRLSVVQPNIPQSVKWVMMAKKDILEIHENLTKVAALREPQLIIWPEAAFPGYLNADYDAARVSRLVKGVNIPLLVGAPYWESQERVFNSVFLMDSTGVITDRYDKIKLVPFGEYVPWKPLLGWLSPLAYTMGVGDFTAGATQKIFKWAKDFPFSVLICFEDVFSGPARQAVQNGAKFLVVVTNDAWFGPTGAPWQHLQSSIFRAVENGVPVVRSSNTGVSGFISAEGKILNLLQQTHGKNLFISGELTFELPMVQHETFYQKGGWLFPYVCIILLGSLFFFKKKGVSL